MIDALELVQNSRNTEFLLLRIKYPNNTPNSLTYILMTNIVTDRVHDTFTIDNNKDKTVIYTTNYTQLRESRSVFRHFKPDNSL